MADRYKRFDIFSFIKMNKKSALSPPLVCCTLTLLIRILWGLFTKISYKSRICVTFYVCFCQNLSKEPVILTSTVSVTPCYTLEVYVHLFHKDAKSFRNLIINIHSVLSPHLGTQILKLSKGGDLKTFRGGGNQKGGGRDFSKKQISWSDPRLGIGGW